MVRRPEVSGLTLDTGALIALDRASGAQRMALRIAGVVHAGGTLCIPANVLAQAWRSPRQVRLARLVRSPDVDIPVLDAAAARVVGAMSAASGHDDIVDIHLVLCALRRNHAVVTSDPDDVARVDPDVPVIHI